MHDKSTPAEFETYQPCSIHRLRVGKEQNSMKLPILIIKQNFHIGIVFNLLWTISPLRSKGKNRLNGEGVINR